MMRFVAFCLLITVSQITTKKEEGELLCVFNSMIIVEDYLGPYVPAEIYTEGTRYKLVANALEITFDELSVITMIERDLVIKITDVKNETTDTPITKTLNSSFAELEKAQQFFDAVETIKKTAVQYNVQDFPRSLQIIPRYELSGLFRHDENGLDRVMNKGCIYFEDLTPNIDGGDISNKQYQFTVKSIDTYDQSEKPYLSFHSSNVGICGNSFEKRVVLSISLTESFLISNYVLTFADRWLDMGKKFVKQFHASGNSDLCSPASELLLTQKTTSMEESGEEASDENDETYSPETDVDM